jgi:RNA polymerase sigma-70 factor (ECF subfamily)
VLDERRAKARAVAAIEALPKRQRDVVSLRVLGQLEFREIASTLGISEANARVNFSQGQKRALQALSIDRDAQPRGES